MSYSYSLFRAPAAGAMSSWGNTPPPSIGPVEAVKDRLATLFGAIRWELSRGVTWFGRVEDAQRAAEIQITPEDGEVRFVTMRRVERREVESVCELLGIVAVDAQTMELYAGEWTQQS